MPPGDYSTEHVLNARLNAISGYQASDDDINISGTSYYGSLKPNGEWYIMRGIKTGNVMAYTYVKGGAGYDFSTRASLTYVAYNLAGF